MIAVDPYNPEVRRRFENPVNAGEPAGEYDYVLEGRASEPGQGAALVLFAGVNDGKIATLRFRAKGCPHLIAAADLFCSRFEGLEPYRLDGVRSADFFESLDVPVNKTGRLLLIEDAALQLLKAAGNPKTGN